MELPQPIYDEITTLSDEGNSLSDDGSFDRAISKWTAALDLVPEPKSNWEASTWLYASIGDARYQQASFDLARSAFLDAMNCPGAETNAFIQYRLGQCEWKLGNEKNAIDRLLRAYMLDGENIFEGEPEGHTFLSLLRQRRLTKN